MLWNFFFHALFGPFRNHRELCYHHRCPDVGSSSGGREQRQRRQGRGLLRRSMGNYLRRWLGCHRCGCCLQNARVRRCNGRPMLRSVWSRVGNDPFGWCPVFWYRGQRWAVRAPRPRSTQLRALGRGWSYLWQEWYTMRDWPRIFKWGEGGAKLRITKFLPSGVEALA